MIETKKIKLVKPISMISKTCLNQGKKYLLNMLFASKPFNTHMTYFKILNPRLKLPI